ncbi:hypothetical protein FRAHR75_670027 [Frankia sp. Hr75.2]|nr:hypothetical protein FRAHR75_670027 [Frankia sp. Hr75.2]SQD94082.1 hypothetical protein FMEAI12_2240013 [Parafrankia sp. Ea1.12]
MDGLDARSISTVGGQGIKNLKPFTWARGPEEILTVSPLINLEGSGSDYGASGTRVERSARNP